MNKHTLEPMAANGNPVTVKNLRKYFGEVKAVDGVDLDVNAGEFVALLGPSGSGKTTILMAIAGFETPDGGHIEIAGADITALPPNKRDIGMVFQRYALFPHMTVAENIGFPLRMRRMPKSKAADQVDRALALVRLQSYGTRRTSQLSGGQQQRVALARALVYNPRVLLMDEPLGALDKNLREEMQLEIKRLQRKLGTTVIYVTHDQSEALTMADRIAVMDQGKIQQYASPQDIYDSPANAFVAGFIGETNFIDGRLDRRGEGWTFVPEQRDEPIGLADGEHTTQWRDGQSAQLTIRPEVIRIGPANPSSVSGTVEELIYCGGTIACLVRVSPANLVTARIPSEDGAGLVVGQAIELHWPTRRAKVFVR